jgi:hypothetical protein
LTIVVGWSGVNPSRSALLGMVVVGAGCAPSLATMQPAHVAPKGHFQATAAVEIGIPTGTISKAIDAGTTVSMRVQNQMSIMSSDERQLFDAGVNFVVSPPSANTHFAINYTVLNNWEVGVRYAAGGWRLGSRYQFLHHEDAPFDMTLGAGVSRIATEVPILSTIPLLDVDDFTRYTVDAGLQIGTSRGFYRAWVGPKFLYSNFSTAMRLDIPNSNLPDLASFEGHGIYYGGQGGLAIGWKHVFLAFELTICELTGTAHATALNPAGSGNTDIATDVDISGLVIYPTFGLLGEF